MKLILLLLVITPLFFSCRRSTEPLLESQDLQLILEDVSCTEVWLSLKEKNEFNGRTLKLYRNDSLVISKELKPIDSLFVDNELEPSTTYTYILRIENGNKLLAKSTLVNATTLDTTSHNFTWQSFEFGGIEHGSSIFFDVAIVDENDIWAVGEVHTEDTDCWNEDSTEWIHPFNAVHWDGVKWNLKRLLYKGGFWDIGTIFAFSEDDIWFEAFINFNGEQFVEKPVSQVLIGYGINKIWGRSSNDFYIVGTKGFIAHYDGQEWRRISSGTDLDFQDIWGVTDSKTGQIKIFAAASNKFHNDGKVVLQIANEKAVPIQTNGLPVSLSGIWSANGKKWYVCGDGLFSSRFLNDQWQSVSDTPQIFQECIRGNASNDIFVTGHLGLVMHWNGVTWHDFSHEPGIYYGLAVKGDLAAVVGTKPVGIVSGSAKILIGKRN